MKSQLPIFNGTSSLSIADASDTWVKILKNSGFHKQVWGNVILGKIQDPALTTIPILVKREAKFDDICSSLSAVYGGAMNFSANIMNAHVKAGTIPDPHLYPDAALKVLRGHFEVMEHASRFIDLSHDKNAAGEIMTGSNLTKILDFMPRRMRCDNLEIAETDAHKRTIQYMAVKNWVTQTQKSLVRQGIKLEEKAETTVTMIATDSQQDRRSQNLDRGGQKGNKGNRRYQQDGRNGGNRNQSA